jgi:hypothetical protein
MKISRIFRMTDGRGAVSSGKEEERYAAQQALQITRHQLLEKPWTSQSRAVGVVTIKCENC